MSSMQFLNLLITPLSPVHLGTGVDYEPTGYVIEDSVLWEFDPVSGVEVLPAAQRQTLDVMLRGYPNERMLRDVQGFFFANRDRLIAISTRQVRVGEQVESFYKERVGRFVQQEIGGRQVQNKLQIERTAWSAGNGNAIVPGSGLKGAIRTALLDEINNGRDMPDREKSRKGASDTLQAKLFDGKFETDPMRLIRVTDAELANSEGPATEVRFALNRKKEKVIKDGRQVASRAEKGNLYQLLECLPPFAVRAFRGALSVQRADGMPSDKWPAREYSATDIARACNRFYRARFDQERRIMAAMNYLDREWDARVENLLGGRLEQEFESGRVFLLRVGRHSGAESVTLNGVRSIKIMRGKGDQPDYLPEAKTLWLAGDSVDSRDKLQPFGWMLIELMETGSVPGVLPGLVEDQTIVDWRGHVARRQNTLRRELEVVRRAEFERKEEEEAVRLAEETRQRAYESMSEEEKQIESLRQVFDREVATGTISANSQTASDRVALLRAALEWESPDYRRMAADLIADTVKKIPWSRRSRIERQVELERLRGTH